MTFALKSLKFFNNKNFGNPKSRLLLRYKARRSGSEGGEWKAGPKPGVPARPGNKITVSSSGYIIKVDR